MAMEYILLQAILCYMLVNTYSVEQRLTQNILPSTYIIRISIPDLHSEKFTANEVVTFIANKEMDYIYLHASPNYINISQIYLNSNNTQNCSWTYSDISSDILQINCPEKIKVGDYNGLQIFYEAAFSVGETGLFKKVYEGDYGKEVVILSKFTPDYARNVFPCFDDISFKTTFNYFITFPEGVDALGSTPVVTSAVNEFGVTYQFETSPVISVSSNGFIISKYFPSLKKADEGHYVYNVYTKTEFLNYTNTALKYGKKLMDALGNWTNIQYDETGIVQLNSATMDDLADNINNLGLIITREENILDEGLETSAQQKEKIFKNLAQQIAGQWFGHFITPVWWNTNWFLQGFSKYLQYHISDEFDGEVEISRLFPIEVLQNALYEDSILSYNKLTMTIDEVMSTSEILSVTTDQNVNKGASIIKMVEGITGKKLFQANIETYIKKHYTADPAAWLEGQNLTNLLDKYLNTPGYPLLTAKLGKNGDSLIISQEPFYLISDQPDTQIRWHVPILYSTSNIKGREIYWLKNDSNLEINIGSSSWIILNYQQMGYYRVNYEDKLWDQIIKVLNGVERNDVDIINRAQLIDDIFSLARVGKVSYAQAFYLLSSIKYENEYLPWITGLKHIESLLFHISDQETLLELKKTVLRWINAAFPSYSIDAKKHTEVLRQSLLLNWKCLLEDEQCLLYAANKYKEYRQTMTFSNPNERELILCYGLKQSEKVLEEYNYLMNRYEHSTLATEKNRILSALGCINNNDIIKKYLTEIVVDSSVIPKYDAIKVYEAVLKNREVGIDAAVEFLQTYMPVLINKYSSLFPLSDFIVKIAEKVSNKTHFDQLEFLVTSNEQLTDTKSLRNLKIIQDNLQWSQKYTQDIKNAVEQLSSSSGRSIYLNNYLWILILIVLYFKIIF